MPCSALWQADAHEVKKRKKRTSSKVSRVDLAYARKTREPVLALASGSDFDDDVPVRAQR